MGLQKETISPLYRAVWALVLGVVRPLVRDVAVPGREALAADGARVLAVLVRGNALAVLHGQVTHEPT